MRGLQAIGIPIQKLDFMNIYGLIVVLSFSLFPYVYASARVLFLSLPKSIYESSMLLGASNKRYFFSVALPLATPAIIGGLFVLETVSVIIQVISFKLTGKRIFKMAPIHHHFEKKGWAESTIVIRFWIIAIILALVGLATLKLR